MPTDKSLVTASNGFPAQNYNVVAGQYKEAHGSDNAAHHKITDPTTGVPIDPRNVVVTSLETRLESLKQLINDQQPLTKKVEVTNQKATQSVDGMVDINNFPTDQKVSDSGVLTKLTELDSKMNGIIDGSTPANTQIVEGNVEAGEYLDTHNNLVVDEPKLVLTIPFSGFSASSTLVLSTNVLNTKAKKRYLFINSTLDIRIDIIQCLPYSELLGYAYLSNNKIECNIPGIYTSGQGATTTNFDELLSVNLNSFRFNIAVGNVAPTEGNLFFRIVEVF